MTTTDDTDGRRPGPEQPRLSARENGTAAFAGIPAVGKVWTRKRLLRCLAAGVAHEVRNPLMAILGYVEQARKTDDAGDAWMAGIEREVERIDRVVEELSELAGPVRPGAGSTEIGELVQTLVGHLEDDGRVKNARLELELAEGLPTLPWGGARVARVLEQLVLNADRAVGVHPGPGEGRVVVKTERVTDRRVAVTVLDNGPGLPAEDPTWVFEPFFTTKDPGEGTGLGLAVARRIVEEMGGTLRAANRPVSGARFTLTLPTGGAGPDGDGPDDFRQRWRRDVDGEVEAT